MLGSLEDDQIDIVLSEQYIGRIGCHGNGITYIVPVNYVYDGINILAHSGFGMKINIMRRNPEVCFQVDQITDIQNWSSVILWGQYEEIHQLEEQQQIMQMLNDRISPLLTAENGHPSHGFTDDASDIGLGNELILYKIKISQKTGHYEKSPH